jgi:D-alanine-D-alanine ligase
MKPKIRVAVLYGGPSEEHDVSLKSGAAILANLSEEYEALPVKIDKTNQWCFESFNKTVPIEQAISLLEQECDVAVLGVHGTFGEDGALQALLEVNNIAHTGSSAASSILAFDKLITATVYAAAELSQPHTSLVNATADLAVFELPFVVKPARQGSSVGVSIVRDRKDAAKATHEAAKYDTKVLVQQFIQGCEVSCGVLEINRKPIALPPTELIPLKGDFFDYESKYSEGGAEEITPPRNLSEEQVAQIKNLAVRAHQALGCQGYSRTDMIVAEDNIYLIETNTLPGLSEASILPKQIAAAGYSFSQLLDYIIHTALAGRTV